MILAETRDFFRFDLPNKPLAFAGLSLSVYQSDKLNDAFAYMEKRCFRYLRYVLINATKFVFL